MLQRRCPGYGQAPVGLSVIPSLWAWSAATGSRWARSIRGGDHAEVSGGHDQHDLHPPRLGSRSRRRGRRRGGQGADVSVAQPVEDQLDELAGGGDHADVAPASGADLVAEPAEAGVPG